MNDLSMEIKALCEIASCIATGNFKLLDKNIRQYKINQLSALKLYECILQSYLFCGFPAAIESIKIFRKYYKDFTTTRSKFNLKEFERSGKNNCKLIYKKNYKKLIENMTFLSPELKNWMIIEGYGKVLGRKGLTLLEREFINISILSTRFFENQLHSHLKGCLYLGATKDELISLLNDLNAIKKKDLKNSLKLIEKL